MSKKEIMPTYDEFKRTVKKYFLEFAGDKWQARAEEYFSSDEAEDVMRSGYESNSIRFKRGDINRLQFLAPGGGAGATAYNLYMLY